MQTLGQIRGLLAELQLRPQKRFGQNFLYDQNLMAKLLELAELTGRETVLEVGPGTGSLTEELLRHAGRVVCVEIDRGLYGLISGRFGDNSRITLIHGDILAGKHEISPQVLDALGKSADMVANLPYNIATPLIINCLISSWLSSHGHEEKTCRFGRLTFTVQREVADRFAAAPNSDAYGPVSVIIALLGRLTAGAIVPPTAFWPPPKVSSRIVRIDYDAEKAEKVADVRRLQQVLTIAFAHRRKQLGSSGRTQDPTLPDGLFAASLEGAGIDPSRRAENIPPEDYLLLANEIAAP